MRQVFADLSILLWGLLLAAGLLLGVAILADAQPARPRTPPACTGYAAPGASGSTCSESAPCSVQTWLTQKASPGGVLCLQSGTYTGDAGMLNIPESVNGTAERPVVIRALQPGAVLIDGNDERRPINTRGSYGIISGIDAARGDNQNVQMNGHHWLIRDLLTWNVGTAGDANINMSGSDNTVEDCGTWGTARKPIAAGASGGDRNTVRRCWTRWEANEHPTSNPSNAIELGYGQNTVTFENIMATWDTKGRVTEPEGIAELFSSQGSKWLGSIFYLPAHARYETDHLVLGATDAGSHAQQGHFNPLTNLIFKHNMAYIDPAHSRFASTRGFYFMEGTDGGPPGENNTLSGLVSVSGVASSFSSRSFPTSNTQWGRSLSDAIGAGKSVWTDSAAAAGICTRYYKGQLTAEPLWPFPMDARISAGLVRSGYPAMSITSVMEQLFGPIPASCKTTGTGPGPTPPSTVPVPPTDVEAVLQGTGVLLSWVDETNTVATGYTVERKVGGGQYAELSTAPEAADRTYTDSAPVRGQNNCYVVYARGSAGPSGFSVPGCVTVPTTPEPPGADRVPLTCEGAIVTGNRVVMTCVPQGSRR